MPEWKRLIHQHLARLRLPPEREMEIAEELAEHLESVYIEALADGLTSEAAHARTLEEIADWPAMEGELSRAELTIEYRMLERPVEVPSRFGRGGILMEAVLQDLRYALRMLVKRPGFALMTTLILSLGIGANVMIFGVLNTLLFRPLPVREPERLVRLFANDHDIEFPHGMSYPDYLDYRQEQTIFGDLAASVGAHMSLNSGGKTTRASTLFVTGNYFSLLGVSALHGRVIVDEDDRKGAPLVAVLGYGCWRQRFGGDPAVVGKTIKLTGQPFTVVGVAPEKMASMSLSSHDVFLAMWVVGDQSLADRGNHSFDLLGRLRAGVTLARAREAVRLSAARLEAAYPETNRGVKVSVQPEIKARYGGLFGQYLEPIAAFAMTLAALALAVACANAANLTLARAATRQKEFAIRAAFGASRWRLIRLLLAESLLLAALSGVAGLLAAPWALDFLTRRSPNFDVDFEVDWRVLAYTFAVALVVGLLTGLTQAWRASMPDLNRALKGGGFGFGDPGRRWLRGSLAVAQVAASALLLVFAGLLLRSADAARKFDPGFRTSNLLLISLDRQGASRETERFCERLLEGARALPGVRAAALASMTPFGPGSNPRIYLDSDQEREAASAISNTVSPDYFRLMEIPIVRGRAFTERDGESAPLV
ncbi:MAG TPA: ABC transporter permease, partial [Blastocatellia bacterium]|nr:ABC transporter permease [Blastocatellia bacterium]